MVVNILNGRASLFRIVKEEVASCLSHISSSSLTAGLELEGITTVIETDVGISTRSINIIYSCFPLDIEHGTHLVLDHYANSFMRFCST